MTGLFCFNRNLTTVPVFDPYAESVPKVDLTFNHIQRVEAYAFANLSVDHRLSIVLRGNPINFVDDLAFDGLQNYTVDLEITRTNLPASPKALVALQNLRTLTTDIPLLSSVAEKLDSLKTLHMAYGSFNESLVGICRLKNLSTLYMYKLAFSTGVSPLPKCSQPMRSVQELTLNVIDLTRFPNLSELFPSLKRLHLGYNNLTSIQSDMLPASLTYLDLGHNKLNDLRPVFAKFRILRTLKLNSNLLTSIAAHSFLGLLSLDTLDLSSNPISSIADEVFENNPKLYHLNLFNAKLTTVPKFIHRFKALSIAVSLNPIKCTCALAWLHGWDAFNSGKVDVFGNCEDRKHTIINYVSSLNVTCEGQPIG